MKLPFTSIEIDLYSSLPLLLLGGAGILVLLLDAFSRLRLVGREHHHKMAAETSEAYVVSPPGSRFYLMPLSLIFLLATLLVVVWQWTRLEPSPGNPGFVLLYQNMLIIDRFGLFTCGLCLIFGMLSIATLPAFFKDRMELGETYALVFFSLLGMMILILANDWVAMFLGIETLSLGVYVLTGAWRRSAKSSEASLKYFLVGAFVSAVLLYGIAILYGATGQTTLVAANSTSLGLWSIGAFLVLGSLAFKIAAVPFHMWAPDTYEGAPSPIAGFMMSAVKTAAFGFLIRFFLTTMQNNVMQSRAQTIFYLLSALTMILGNFAALRQQNVKRLLAYSSIAHAGYLLLAVLILRQSNQQGLGIILYYLLSYGVTAIGTLAIVCWVGTGSKDEELAELSHFEGLGQRRPFAAFTMTVLLLSLAGFPPTAGFLAKFYLFRAALEDTTLWPLIFLALFTSLISVGYYLKIVTAMYFKKPLVVSESVTKTPHSVALVVVVFITLVCILGMGFLPNWFFQTAFSATIKGGL